MNLILSFQSQFYNSLDSLEKDMDQVFNNAKIYNEESSLLYKVFIYIQISRIFFPEVSSSLQKELHLNRITSCSVQIATLVIKCRGFMQIGLSVMFKKFLWCCGFAGRTVSRTGFDPMVQLGCLCFRDPST